MLNINVNYAQVCAKVVHLMDVLPTLLSVIHLTACS